MEEMRNRKRIRLEGYDYSREGYYFVTICIKDRHEILGCVVGDAALGVPFVRLSEIGTMVKQHIENINLHSGAHVINYVVMPNHIHLLIHLKNGTPRAASPTKAELPKIINALKGLTTKKFGESMWQRGYHDHIVRNEDEYVKIYRYIDENPARWTEDEFYAGNQGAIIMDKKNKLTFEQAVSRIDEIVKTLERGDAPLDKSLELFEEGAGLIKTCGKMLDNAEQKVVRLQKGADENPEEHDFDDAE